MTRDTDPNSQSQMLATPASATSSTDERPRRGAIVDPNDRRAPRSPHGTHCSGAR